jgi:hypothetical protein
MLYEVETLKLNQLPKRIYAKKRKLDIVKKKGKAE